MKRIFFITFALSLCFSTAFAMNEVDLYNAPVTRIDPNKLAPLFRLGSDYTDLQREEALEEIGNKVIQWQVPVYEISRIKSSDLYRIIATWNNGLGAIIELTAITPEQVKYIYSLRAGDKLSIKGRLTGETTMRALEISPAIIWDESSAHSESTKKQTNNFLEDEPSIPSYIKGNPYSNNSRSFFIPENAMSNNNLSFMSGCWRSDGINYYTDPKKPYVAPAEFCFNEDGEGSFYAFPKGTKCVSKANAFFRKSMLIITTDKGTCEQSSRFLMPRTFQCEGSGENTMCYTVAKYKNEIFQDRAIFFRK